MNNIVGISFLSGSNITGDVYSNLHPLELDYIASTNLQFKNTPITFNDGFRFYTSSILTDAKDIAATKNTLYYLTKGQTWDDFIYDGYNTAAGSINSNQQIDFDKAGFFYAFIRCQSPSFNPYSFIGPTDLSSLSTTEPKQSLAKFVKLSNGKYNIFFYKQNTTHDTIEYILTVDTSSEFDVLKIVKATLKSSNYVQEFNIRAIEDNMVQITYDEPVYKNYQYPIYIDLVKNDVLSPSPVIEKVVGNINNFLESCGVYRPLTDEMSNVNKYASNTNIYSTAVFNLINEGRYPLQLGIESDKHNVWIGYYNEIFNKANNKNVDPNPEITVTRVPINYLVTSNFKSDADLENKKLKINICPLKSTYTPEQENIKTTTVNIDGIPLIDAPENLQPIQRTYNKLFVSNNEMDNYSKVHLGYSAGTREIKFAADTNTFFHYPLQASILPLSAGALIEAGAIPGATPYLSDKIFMKNASYGTFNHWGHLVPPPGCLNGQFLCSWLSGSDASSLSGLENSVWVDRWYDSSKICEVSALQTGINSISSNNSSFTIYDEPSKMVLNPGGWYYYHHVGNNIMNDFINSFNINNTALRLNLQCSINNIKDISSYENIIEITNKKDDTFKVNNPDEILKENYVLSLDGTNYAKLQYNKSIELTSDITVSTWIYGDKWKNNPGHHILDNGFRGGWAITLANGFYNPTVAIGESTYGHILNFSNNLIPYTDNMLVSGVGQSIDPDNVVVTDDLYVFVFDKNNKTLCKFEYTGDLIDLIDLSAHVDVVNNSKLQLGPDNNLYLHFNSMLIKTDLNFTQSSRIIKTDFNYTNFTIDLSGNIIGGNFVDVAVDNNNVLWYISSCPVEFFTQYNQPYMGENGSFFMGTPEVDVAYDGSSISEAITSMNAMNYIFYSTEENRNIIDSIGYVNSAVPMHVIDLNGNLITFSTFFYNNAKNGILSRFYQPMRLVVDEKNYMYIINDTQEITKVVISSDQRTGFIYRKNLISDKQTTGLSMEVLNQYKLDLINETNGVNRDDPTYEYIKLTQTDTLWKDVSSNYTKQDYISLLYEYDKIYNEFKTYMYYVDNTSGIMYKFDTDGEYISSIKLTDGYDTRSLSTIDTTFTNYTNIATTYDWHRKYTLNTSDNNDSDIRMYLYTIEGNNITKHTLQSRSHELITDDWHHVAFTYSKDSGEILLYLNGVIVDSKTISPNQQIYYKYKNDIGIGTSMLRSGTLYEELKTDSYLFNGGIDDVRIYDYPLTRGNIGRIILNKYKIHDMTWNIPVGLKNYIEQIEHFFKHKIPGSKSNMFDIYLSNTGIDNQDMRIEIEKIIRESIPRITPNYTKLNNIYWTESI